MEGISPEQLRAAIDRVGNEIQLDPFDNPFQGDVLTLLTAANELLMLKESTPAHQDYDVALPEIEEWVNKSGAW